MRQRASKAPRRNFLEPLGLSGFKAASDFVTRVTFPARQKGFFVLFVEFEGRIMQAQSAHRFLAVCLTLFGYLGDAHGGALPMNSNAIKNLPGVFGSKGADTVSPSPRTSPSGHKFLDTLQVKGARKSRFSAPRNKLRFCTFQKSRLLNSYKVLCFCSLIADRCLHG